MRFRVTMQIWMRHFNLYFALAAALALFAVGCKTDKKDKIFSAMRIHMEVSRMTATGTTISVIRSNPVLVSVARDPILTESDVYGARLIDAQGGFALQISFDEQSTWILEQYTAGNPGKHFAIFGQWSDSTNDARWLAAPLITHHISDGVLTFTPDMSRAEAEQLVLGLNNDAKKLQKSTPKSLR